MENLGELRQRARLSSSTAEQQRRMALRQAAGFYHLHDLAQNEELKTKKTTTLTSKKASVMSRSEGVRKNAELELQQLSAMPPGSYKWTWGAALTDRQVLASSTTQRSRGKIHSGYVVSLLDGGVYAGDESATPVMSQTASADNFSNIATSLSAARAPVTPGPHESHDIVEILTTMSPIMEEESETLEYVDVDPLAAKFSARPPLPTSPASGSQHLDADAAGNLLLSSPGGTSRRGSGNDTHLTGTSDSASDELDAQGAGDILLSSPVAQSPRGSDSPSTSDSGGNIRTAADAVDLLSSSGSNDDADREADAGLLTAGDAMRIVTGTTYSSKQQYPSVQTDRHIHDRRPISQPAQPLTRPTVQPGPTTPSTTITPSRITLTPSRFTSEYFDFIDDAWLDPDEGNGEDDDAGGDNTFL